MVENIRTKIQINPTIFRDSEFWGGLHPGVERGGISVSGQNPPLGTVAENLHTKFYENWTIFREPRILGEPPSPGGGGGEEISRKRQEKSFSIVVMKICTIFQDNPTIFRHSDEFWWGTGGEFRKKSSRKRSRFSLIEHVYQVSSRPDSI